MDPQHPDYWHKFELVKLPVDCLIKVSDLMAPHCRTALRQVCKLTKACIHLPGVIVVAHSDDTGVLSPLPVQHLPTVDGTHRKLLLNLSSLPDQVPPASAVANLKRSISSHLQSLQSFLSLEVRGPSWSLEVVMAELSKPVAAAEGSDPLSSVTSLTLVNSGSDKHHRCFSPSLCAIISYMHSLASLIVCALEMDLCVLSQLCNSKPLLKAVTVKCNRWSGILMLPYIQQLHIMFNTHTPRLRVAALCFTHGSLPAVKQLSFTHIDPLERGYNQDDSPMNTFLQAVLPKCPDLEGVFLEVDESTHNRRPILNRRTFSVLASSPKLQQLLTGGFEIRAGEGMILSSLTHLTATFLYAKQLCGFAPALVELHVASLGCDPALLPPGITHLSVHENDLPTAAAAVTHLRVELSDDDEDNTLDTFGFPNLKSFHIEFGGRERLAAEVQALQHHPHLTHLCLSNGHDLDDAAVTAIIHCNSLTHLQLDGTNVTSQRLQHLIAGMPHLMCISVHCGYSDIDDDIPADTEACRRIQRSSVCPLHFRLQSFDGQP